MRRAHKLGRKRSAHARQARARQFSHITEPKRHRSLARQITTRYRGRAEQHDAAHKLWCARSAARSRRARGRQYSRVPGNTSSFLTLARSDHDLRMRLGLRQLTEQARALVGRSAGGQAPSSERAPNESLQPRAEGVACPSLRVSAESAEPALADSAPARAHPRVDSAAHSSRPKWRASTN